MRTCAPNLWEKVQWYRFTTKVPSHCRHGENVGGHAKTDSSVANSTEEQLKNVHKRVDKSQSNTLLQKVKFLIRPTICG